MSSEASTSAAAAEQPQASTAASESSATPEVRKYVEQMFGPSSDAPGEEQPAHSAKRVAHAAAPADAAPTPVPAPPAQTELEQVRAALIAAGHPPCSWFGFGPLFQSQSASRTCLPAEDTFLYAHIPRDVQLTSYQEDGIGALQLGDQFWLSRQELHSLHPLDDNVEELPTRVIEADSRFAYTMRSLCTSVNEHRMSMLETQFMLDAGLTPFNYAKVETGIHHASLADRMEHVYRTMATYGLFFRTWLRDGSREYDTRSLQWREGTGDQLDALNTVMELSGHNWSSIGRLLLVVEAAAPATPSELRMRLALEKLERYRTMLLPRVAVDFGEYNPLFRDDIEAVVVTYNKTIKREYSCCLKHMEKMLGFLEQQQCVKKDADGRYIACLSADACRVLYAFSRIDVPFDPMAFVLRTEKTRLGQILGELRPLVRPVRVALCDANAVLRMASAADAGRMDALYGLAWYYEEGYAMARSHEKAVQLWKRALDSGEGRAGFVLAELAFADDKEVLRECDKPKEQVALEYMAKASKLGNKSASKYLQMCYEEGRDVDKSDAKAEEMKKRAEAQKEVHVVDWIGV